MSTIERSISTHGSGAWEGWRAVVVVVALVVGLATGFGLGRTATSSDSVAPGIPASSVHGIQGPGHVPRHRTARVDGDMHVAGPHAVPFSWSAPSRTGKDER